MPALDSCHQQIVNALVKAGWEIDAQSYYVRYEGFEVYPDIRAHQTNGHAEEIPVVEVKCFSDEDNYRDDLYRAIGQYLIYRNIHKIKQTAAKTYLALPSFAYNLLFKNRVVTETINEAKINLLVVDVEKEEIIQWVG